MWSVVTALISPDIWRLIEIRWSQLSCLPQLIYDKTNARNASWILMYYFHRKYHNYCPKGLLCREVPKIAVCLSVRSFVRASVRPFVRSSVRTFFDHLPSTENGAIKGIWSKRKIKTGPKCQKCNALDLRSEGK